MNRKRRGILALTVALLAACSDGGKDSASDADFCNTATAAKASTDAQQELFSLDEAPTPDQIQVVVEDFASTFAAMTAAAPDEIKADVTTMNKAAQQLLQVVEANGFDVAKLIDAPEFTELSNVLTGDEYEAAQVRFQDYTESNCEIVTTPGT